MRRRSRHSNQAAASANTRDDATGGSKIPLKGSPSTPRLKSPLRRARRGISLLQKQALIDNLQLESPSWPPSPCPGPPPTAAHADPRCSHRTRSEAAGTIPSSGPGVTIANRNTRQSDSHVTAQSQDGRVGPPMLGAGAAKPVSGRSATADAGQGRASPVSPKA